ncbi:TetR family transcriptional regulator [Micromonosporaceae bacterium B7E4]
MAYLAAEVRRQSIVDAAVNVIASEGLAGATTRRIAEEAGAPLGSLHYCFRNKDELIQLVADRGAEMLQAFFEPVDPGRGLEATIRACIDAMWQWVQDNAGLQFALIELGIWRIRQGGKAKDVYAMWNRFGGDLLREKLRAATAADRRELTIPVEEVVRFINHRFDGLVLEYVASKDRAACQRQIELLADALVAVGLSRAPRAPRSRRNSPAR